MKKRTIAIFSFLSIVGLLITSPCFGIPLRISEGTYTYNGETTSIRGWVDLYDRGYVPENQVPINGIYLSIYIDGLDPFHLGAEGDSDVYPDRHRTGEIYDLGPGTDPYLPDPFGREYYGILDGWLYYKSSDWAEGIPGYGSNWASAIDCTYTGFDVISLRFTDADGIWGSIAFSSAAPVPEPSTIVLMGLGLVGLAGIGRKKIKK